MFLKHSKTKYDHLFEKKKKEIAAVKPKDAKTSPLFEQTAFSKDDNDMNVKQTQVVAFSTFVIIGYVFKFVWMLTWIFESPAMLLLVTLPNFIAANFLLLILTLMVTAYVKWVIYCIAAKMMGYLVLTPMCEFYLHDVYANPINCASLLIFNRPEGKPEDIIKTFTDRMTDKDRAQSIIVKKWGKYFLKPSNEEEKKRWRRDHSGVIEDIKTDQEALDFAMKWKLVKTKDPGDMPNDIFYIPYLNENEGAILGMGPHFVYDGLSQFQMIYQCSDNPRGQEYPFIKRRSPSMLEWLGVCLMIPYMVQTILECYYRHPDDVNCIKKHPWHASGVSQSRNAITVSVKKLKAIAKKKDATLNDFVLALMSNVLREYFDSKGDKNEQITLQIPVSFKAIPQNPDDYTYGVCFSGLTLYLKMQKGFDEALTTVKALVREQVKSFPVSMFMLMTLQVQLHSPFKVAKISRDNGAKHTMAFSNFPGYIKPVYYCGGLSKRFILMGGSTGNCASIFTAVSILKRLNINLTSDQTQIGDIDAFIGMFNRRILELGVQYEDDEEGKE